MSDIYIIGCGFVADLYMKSLATFPDISVAGVFDRDPGRLSAFSSHWNVKPAASLDEIRRALATQPADGFGEWVSAMVARAATAPEIEEPI